MSWLVLTLGTAAPPLKLTLYQASSTDGGKTWSIPAIIDQGSGDIDVITGGGNGSGSFVDKQWMAVDQSGSALEGNLYVSYTRFDIIDSSNVSAKILVKTKKKTETAFGTSVQINQTDYTMVQFSSIDVDPLGNVHVSFFAGNSDDELGLYHAVSTDGGLSFLPEEKITDLFFPGLIDGTATYTIPGMPDDRLYPCPHIRAGKTPGVLYVTWSSAGILNAETPGYDVWLAKSTDNGQTWKNPVRVNQDADPKAQQYYPALTVSPNGTLCISYYDRSSDPEGTNTQYVVSYSQDEGASFFSPLQASTVASDFAQIGGLNGGFGIGEYTQVVATDNFAIPVWADGRSNNGDIDLYAAVLALAGPFSSAGEIGTITDAFNLSLVNPAQGSIQLTVNLLKNSPLAIRVFSQDGKTIFEENDKTERTAGVYQHQVALPPGIYLCRVDTAFGFKVRQVIVL